MHEFRGQPVEQFGIDGPFALRAEILQNLGKAGPEELAPQAVDKSARGERILRRHQPVRQIQARGAAAARIEFARNAGTAGSTISWVSSIQLARGKMRVTRGRVDSVRITRGTFAESKSRSARRCARRM